MMLLGMLPAASAFASTAPAVTSVTLTSSANGTATPGSNVTFTASATQTGSGTPMYQFWTESPNGTWTATGWSTTNTYTLQNVQAGSYEVVAYAKDKGQTMPISSESTYSNQFVNVDTSLTFTTNAKDVAPLSPVTITATAKNFTNVVYQYWIGTPNGNGGYTWVANGDYTTSNTYTFTPPTAGTYKIAVYAKDLNAPQDAQFANAQGANEGVYGTQAGVALSLQRSSVVADNVQTDTVTAKVVDANGNVVADYNGPVTLTDTNTWLVTGTTSAGTNELGSTLTATATNGVATFTVQAPGVPGLTDTLTSSGLTGTASGSTPSYGTASVTSVPQTATSISVTTSANNLEVNDNSGTVSGYVQVEDQAGNPMLGGTYVLDANLIGGGTLTYSGVSGTTSATVVVSAGASQTVTIDGVQGKTGTYVLSVTGSGLTAGAADVSAVVAGNAAAITGTDATPTLQAGTGSTTVTVGAKDASGNIVALPSTVVPVVTITDSQGNAVTGLTVSDTTTGTVTGTAGTYTLGAGDTSFTLTDPTGAAPAGTYTVSVSDQAGTLTSSTLDVTVTSGAAATVTVAGATNVLTGTSLSTELTINVTDQYGNPVADNNVPITVSATGGVGSAEIGSSGYSAAPTATVYTNANGVATVTFAAQNYSGSWTVSATAASGALASGSATATATTTEFVETHPVASYSFGLKDTASSGTYSGNTVYAQAGDPVTIEATKTAPLTSGLVYAGVDANGNTVSSTTAGNDNVTVTIAHATGLSNIGTGSVTIADNTTTNVETITGTLSNVSTALSTATAAAAGEVTISVKDNSTGAQGSAAIDVVAGTTASELVFSGISNNETLKAGTTYTVTVSLADLGGNAVVSGTSTTVTLSGSTGLAFETTAGYPATNVVIGAGQTSATFLVVTAPSGTTISNGTVSGSASTLTGEVSGLSD